ncbi:MAG: plasmid pRiA4b ORF-3 family protein [Sporichthyaceae bacterium]
MRPQLSPDAEVVEFEVRLRGAVPAVWRHFAIPAAASLADLHAVLQATMGWTNSHLHEFTVGGRRFGPPDPDGDDDELLDERRTTVAQIARVGAPMEYVYDFGEEWHHDLTVRQISVAEPWTRYPRCLDGAGSCPPEDGGARVEAGFDPGAADWALTRLAWRPAAPAPAGGAEPIVLRCTGKLLKVLKPGADRIVEVEPSPRDWYANLVWIDGRKCVLAVHAETLSAVFLSDVRAADLRPIGAVLVPAVHAELAREHLPADAFGRLEASAVALAKTADRRVLGAMRDLALRCEFAAAQDGGLAALDLADLHRGLQRHLILARGAVRPIDLVRRRVGPGE